MKRIQNNLELISSDFTSSIIIYDENTFFLRCALSDIALKKLAAFNNLPDITLIVIIGSTRLVFMKKAWELINDYLYLDFNFKKKIISEINDRINHRENCRFKNLDLIAFLTRHRKFAINLISFWYPLDEIQLENYSNQLNWWYLSYNPNVLWNEFLFDKYVAKIDWLSFCDNIGFPCF